MVYELFCRAGFSLLTDPFVELVLQDYHALSDSDCGEIFAVHKLISSAAADTEQLSDIAGVKRDFISHEGNFLSMKRDAITAILAPL